MTRAPAGASTRSLPPPPATASRHLRWLRNAVPGERLFAPRVVLMLGTEDAGWLVDERGQLPAAEIELEGSIRATAEALIALAPDRLARPLSPVTVLTGSEWWEEHPDLGPLQPIWIVLGAPTAWPGGPTRPSAELPLAAAASEGMSARPRATPPLEGRTSDGGRDYIHRVRARIGRQRVFYPWAGVALRDDAGRIFLVRLAQNGQWHCPGGGMEIGETPEETAAREVHEETGLLVEPGPLIGAFSSHLRSFANGDRIQGIVTFMSGRVIGGTLRPDVTGEIDGAGFYGPDELPPLEPPWDARVRLALGEPVPAID